MDTQNSEFGSQEIFYTKYYENVLFQKGFGSKAVAKTHRSMEAGFKGEHFNQVLEVGGGKGEHLDFIQHSYDKYVISDLKLPKLNKKWSSEKRITPLEANVENLPFENFTFDRVIVTCLLHHVEKPERALEEIKRVLKPNGVATIFLSCDPGFMVRLLRFFSTKHQARKLGFEGYSLMIARDHRNHVASLLEITRYVFRDRNFKSSYHPFQVPSWNLNGYIVLQIG